MNYDCLIFREINFRNRFQRFQILVIFLFNRPIFGLDCPLRVFNLTDFYLLFFSFDPFFLKNVFNEKNLKSVTAWKIWLIALVWCLLLVLVGNKHVTEVNRFLFWMEGSKGVSNTCTSICYYERNQFFMPSFKIASNLFIIIFINKFNDSINMIYCAIFTVSIPRHPSDLEKIL